MTMTNIGEHKTIRAVDGSEKPPLAEPEKYGDWSFDFTIDESPSPDMLSERQRIVGDVLGVLSVAAQREFADYDPRTVKHLFTHNIRPAKMRRIEKYMGYTLSTSEFGTHSTGRPRRRKDLNMDEIVDRRLAELQETNHPTYQVIQALRRQYGDKILQTDIYDVAADILIITGESRFKAIVETMIENWRGTKEVIAEAEPKFHPGMKGRPSRVAKKEGGKEESKKASRNFSKPRHATKKAVKKTTPRINGSRARGGWKGPNPSFAKSDSSHTRRHRAHPKRKPGSGESKIY